MDKRIENLKSIFKDKKLFIIFLFALFSVFSFSKEQELEKIVLAIKWDHKFQFAGYYAAKEKGFYEAKGLDVEIREIKGTENPVDTVISGKAQFGIGGSELIVDKANGKNIIILASIFQHSHLGFVARKDSGIENIHQIKGKKIAMSSHSKELLVYLYNEGIDINRLNISPKPLVNDGYVLDEFDISSYSLLDSTYGFDKRDIETVFFSSKGSGMDFYGDSIFTSEHYFKKNVGVVEDFLAASFDGWDYALNNKSEIVDIIYEKYSAKRSRVQLMNEAMEVDKVIMPQIVKIGYTNKGRWDFIAKEYKNAGLIKEDIDIDKFIFRQSIEIETKQFFKISLGLIIFIVCVIIINRIIIRYNKRLKKEMKEKNILLDMITRSEGELREFLTIIEHIPISVVITDIKGNINYGNTAVFDASGYTKEELLGKNPSIFKSGFHTEEFYKEMWDTISSGNEWHGEFRNMKKNGEVYWERTIIIPVKNEDGLIYSYLAIKEDITDKKMQMELLQTQAERDDLTGLYNRRFGIRILTNEIEKAKENETSLFVCFVDLNKLKYVNDYFGHDYGDEMIKIFSDTVAGELRERDIFFRIGGDEFVIIFSNCTIEIIERVWDRIKEALEIENKNGNRLYNISASHGIVQYEEKFSGVEEFLAEADKKMYEEKRMSRIER